MGVSVSPMPHEQEYVAPFLNNVLAVTNYYMQASIADGFKSMGFLISKDREDILAFFSICLIKISCLIHLTSALQS